MCIGWGRHAPECTVQVLAQPAWAPARRSAACLPTLGQHLGPERITGTAGTAGTAGSAPLTSHDGSLLGSAFTAHLNSSRASSGLPASRSSIAQACAAWRRMGEGRVRAGAQAHGGAGLTQQAAGGVQANAGSKRCRCCGHGLPGTPCRRKARGAMRPRWLAGKAPELQGVARGQVQGIAACAGSQPPASAAAAMRSGQAAERQRQQQRQRQEHPFHAPVS